MNLKIFVVSAKMTNFVGNSILFLEKIELTNAKK